MGADGRFPYPKEVWSPAGGWWPYPKKWKSNTAAAFLITAVLVAPVFIFSENRSKRYGEPRMPIPWRPNLKVKEDN